MPIYEFICHDCGEEFEELVRSASTIEGVLCPECQSEQVTKKISIFASNASGGKATSYWGGSSSSSCSTGKST